jgi:hypothetical protein
MEKGHTLGGGRGGRDQPRILSEIFGSRRGATGSPPRLVEDEAHGLEESEEMASVGRGHLRRRPCEREREVQE